MTDKPILFSGPMVRALLEGRKTQTRRIVMPQPQQNVDGWDWGWKAPRKTVLGNQLWRNDVSPRLGAYCPYGQPGDLLWVREKHAGVEVGGYGIGNRFLVYDEEWQKEGGVGPLVPLPKELRSWPGRRFGIFPSIHMPRWASRLTLEITGVRVERLQDISEQDAKTEGVEPLDFEREEHDYSICPKCGGTCLHNGLGANGGVIFDLDCTACDTHKNRYQHLWNLINGPGSWKANPWVWCLSFRVHQKNVDEMLRERAA